MDPIHRKDQYLWYIIFATYWSHGFILISLSMEKHCSNRLLCSVSGSSVPRYKHPHVSTKQQIPTESILLESFEHPGLCELFMMTTELRNGVSFCLHFSWWDTVPRLWQTPFWRCVNCYNWVKMCAAPSESEGREPAPSDICSDLRCSQVALCFLHQTLLIPHIHK